MQATRFMRNVSGVRLGLFGYGVIEPDQIITVTDENFINANFAEVKTETPHKSATKSDNTQTVPAKESISKTS